jgi:hypothetical protein
VNKPEQRNNKGREYAGHQKSPGAARLNV